MKAAQSCPILCDLTDCTCQVPLSMWTHQVRVLERVAISFSRGLFQPRDQTQVSFIAGRFITIRATREALPGGKVNKNPPARAGDTSSIPGPEVATCHGATKPEHQNYWAPELLSPCAATTEAQAPRAYSPQQEKPPQWETHALQQSSPRSPKLEKAHAQQPRPSAAKNK